MSRENRLQQLLDTRLVWQPGKSCGAQQIMATGFRDLDYWLGGGWPLGVLIEVLLEAPGAGELSLLMPALRQFAASSPPDDAVAAEYLQAYSGQVAWIAPPFVPYAPALIQHGLDLRRMLVVDSVDSRDALWAMEQALRSSVCVAVFGWFAAIDGRAMRRLQLAAEAGGSWAVVLRHSRFVSSVSTAPVRIEVTPRGAETELYLHRNRYGLTGSLCVPC